LYSENDDEFQLTDDEDLDVKTNLITKIPDRLLYLVVNEPFE